MANPGNPQLTLNPKDFQSIEVTVVLKNLTSGSQEIGPKGVQLLEMMERGFVLSVERHFCATGQQLEVLVTAKAGGATCSALRGTAKVMETAIGVDQSESVTLKLIQFREEEWQKLQSIYTRRQNEILEFFKAIKGIE